MTVQEYRIAGRVVDSNGLLTGSKPTAAEYEKLPPFPEDLMTDHLRKYFQERAVS